MFVRFEEQLRSLGYASYADYLRSDHWSDMKDRYKARWPDMKCLGCADRSAEMHHVSYDRLGDEGLRDLIPLCRTCHSDMHLFLKTHPSVHIKDIYASLCGAFGICYSEASQRLAAYHSILAKDAKLSIFPRPEAAKRKRNQTVHQQTSDYCRATGRDHNHSFFRKYGPDGEPRELRIGVALAGPESVVLLQVWQMTPTGRWNNLDAGIRLRVDQAEELAASIGRLTRPEATRALTPPWERIAG